MAKKPHFPDYDCIIVGAGFAGCLQAIRLAKAGFHIALVEQRPLAALQQPSTDGRTVAIATGNIPLLEACGVWPALADDNRRIDSILVRDVPSGADCHFAPDDGRPLGYILDNIDLHKALLSALRTAGVHVHAEYRFTEIQSSHSHVQLSDGKTPLKGQLLIGADGKASAVRRALNIHSRWHDYHHQAIVAVIAHNKPHRQQAFELFLPTGPLALLPMPEQRSALIWTWPEEQAQAMARLPEATFSYAVSRHMADYLGDCTLVSARRCYPLSAHLAEPCYKAGAVLIADAAHSLHPIAGQGLNLGMRDIVTLSDYLIAQRQRGLPLGDSALLAQYHQARLPDVQLMLAATHGLNGLFERRMPLMRWGRGLGLSGVDKLPALKQRFMAHAMGLSAMLRAS